MSDKHTPGPWAWDGNDLDSTVNPFTSVMNPEVSCGMYCLGGSVHLNISEPDRSLIKAAPDMLSALEGLCNMKGEDVSEWSLEWDAAYAAVAKAKESAA